jgi:hypothetical protein
LRHIFFKKFYDPKTLTGELVAEVRATGHPDTMAALLEVSFSLGDLVIIDAIMSGSDLKPSFGSILRKRIVADSSVAHLAENWSKDTVVINEDFIELLICIGRPKALKSILERNKSVVKDPSAFFRNLCLNKRMNFEKSNSTGGGYFGRVEDALKEFVEIYPEVRNAEPFSYPRGSL